MRSRSNGGVIGAYALPTQNSANGVFFIHDAAIYNTGLNPIWPLGTGYIYSATGGTITIAADNSNYKLHTFTANGTFSVVTGSAYIDIFLVGGGGGGGGTSSVNSPYSYSRAVGGGGSGGTVLLAQNVWVPAGTSFTVEVGQGGLGTSATNTTSGSNLWPSYGKPSKVVSGLGYGYTAYGGGYGGGNFDNQLYNSSKGGGGMYVYLWGTGNGSSPDTASGSPGTITITSPTPTGGAGYSTTVGGTQCGAGGGGAGYTSGYAGNYSTNTALACCGGNGYLWSRTGYYYGAGGAGGAHTELYANNSRYSGLYYNGTKQANKAITAAAQGGVYNGAAITNGSGYGVGGNGGSSAYNTQYSTEASGSDGTTGTVIFCYRYK